MIVERAEHPDVDVERLPRRRGRRRAAGCSSTRTASRSRCSLSSQERGIAITHVLVTHQHGDHVVDLAGLAQRFGVPVVGSALTKDAGVPIDETFDDGDVVRSGSLEIQAIATPGHCPDHFALLVNGTDCLTADCLFKGTVGGTRGGGPTGYADQVELDHEPADEPAARDAHPSRAHAALDGRRGVGAKPVHPHLARRRSRREPSSAAWAGRRRRSILFGPDYDGTHKAWVRYPDGRDAIVGGSQVERG